MKIPEIVFYSDPKRYARKDTDVEIPALPKILQAGGLYDINRWGKDNVDLTEEIHYRCFKCLGGLSYSVSRHWNTYVRGLKTFMSWYKFECLHHEKILYHDKLGYACTVDMIGRFNLEHIVGQKFEAVIKIKLPNEPHEAGMETAGQKLAAIRNGLVKRSARTGILTLAETYPYWEYQDLSLKESETAFLGILKDYKPGVTK